MNHLSLELKEAKFALRQSFYSLHVVPFEIVRIVSEQTIELRKMKCIPVPKDEKDFEPNLWRFESDESEPIIRVRFSKKRDLWWKDGYYFTLTNEPRRYYDYGA